MALDSQFRRVGGGGRYMSSRRRRGRRWPVALAVGGGLVLVTWLVWPGGGADNEPPAPVADAGPTATPAEADAAREAEASDSDGEVASSQGRETPQADVPTDPDDAPAFTLGAPVTDASDAERESDRAGQGAQATQASASERREQARSRDADDAADAGERQQSSQFGHASQSSQGSATAVNDLEPAGEASADDDDPASRARTAARGADGDFQRGMELIAERDFVEGRRVLSRLLYSDRLGRSDARSVRDTLESVNRELVFSSEVVSGDPIVEHYTVQSGDTLGAIARQYQVPHQFIMQINGLERARDLQAGQRIKLIKGPFHARVYKREFRMDMTVTGPDGEPIYITSFPVGLGENDSTPPGEWIVATGRKVVNPSWRNPRTGEFFSADDPENPIGNYWIALDGADENTRDLSGYGLHGTIEPESVGAEESMGCIRLLDDDIEQTFHMLQEGQSRVSVYP